MNADLFVKRFLPVAQKVEEETGVWAEAQLVQAALETGWGTRVKGNNFFGIKAKSGGLVRTKEVMDSPNHKFPVIHSITPVVRNGKKMWEYDVSDYFSTYHNPIDSFRGYAEFVKVNPIYKKALDADNVVEFLIEVANAGYATDPDYKGKLLSVLDSVRRRIT